jgi:hypothetical protein
LCQVMALVGDVALDEELEAHGRVIANDTHYAKAVCGDASNHVF